MTPHELESAGERLFGENWKGQIADALGIDASTRWRILQRSKVPGPVAAAVSSWLTLYGAFRILPPLTPLGPFRTDAGGVFELLSQQYKIDVPQVAEAIFGEQWKTAVSDCLGINYSTFWRQMDAQDFPPQVVATMRAWNLIYLLTGIVPEPMEEADKSVEKPVRSKGSKYGKLISE